MPQLRKDVSSILLKSLVSLAVAPALVTTVASAIAFEKAFAQSSAADASFSLPSSLPNGTDINVDGSSSMTVINEALKQRFEERFPGTTVDLASGGTDAALEALLNGTIELAAVGRPLTDEEKAQGLTEVPISREKIAIIVGPNNSFAGDLTFEQFAQIFRGEITDWSQVGGQPGPIRLIDRPDFSDTRRALSQYEVFKTAPFAAGSTATPVAQDDTAAVVQALGNDGIGYAIASQVLNQDNVRVLSMHGTLPDDPRYPYSQPRGYVYKGELSPGAQAFLGFATSAPGQEVVEEAKAAEAAAVASASPSVAASPSIVASPAVEASPSPEIAAAAAAPAPGLAFDPSRLWWLLLPLLGLPLLLWLVKGKGAAPVAADRSRLLLTPRNCRDAYAYWELSDRDYNTLKGTGRKPQVRLYDVTDIPDMDRQTPHSVREFSCDVDTQDLHLPIALDDRDYIAELGYLDADTNVWHRMLRSPHVRVPACAPATTKGLSTVAAGLAGAGALGAAGLAAKVLGDREPVDTSRIVLAQRNDKDAYAYWEVPESKRADYRLNGGRNLKLRVHDATGIDLDTQAPHSTREYDVSDMATDLHIPLPPADRDYVAEVGYLTDDNRWLSLARSLAVRITPGLSSEASKAAGLAGLVVGIAGVAGAAAAKAGDLKETLSDVAEDTAKSVTGRFGDVSGKVGDLVGDASGKATELKTDLGTGIGSVLAGAGAALAGVGAAATSLLDRDRLVGANDASGEDGACRIILVPRAAKEGYAYWEVSDNYKRALREQGGRKLQLRIHDATDIDIDYVAPHSTQTYDISEHDQDKHVPLPVNPIPNSATSYRDYIAELGYLTDDNRWLRIIRSFHVRVPV